MKAHGKEWVRRMLCSLIAALIFSSTVLLPYASTTQYGAALYGSGGTIDEKLSGTVINCMLQDSGGFLWFGTRTGLYRYNGNLLEPYNFSSDVSNQFVSNFITAICEDASKNIWVGTFGGGLFRLNPETKEYVNFNSSVQNRHRLSDDTIRAICGDDAGRLWIGTQNKGLDCLDIASGLFTHYENRTDNADSISANTVTSICKDRSGKLWIGTDGGGLNSFDPQSGVFLQYKNRSGQPGGPGDDNISALYIDKTGILWIVAAGGGLSRLNTVSGEFMSVDSGELESLSVSTVCEDVSGALWIGTYGNGAGILDRDSGEYTAYDFGFTQNTYSSDYRVLSLYADTSGDMWIGTEGSGVGKINTNLNFMSYNSNTGAGFGFSDDVVLSICKDRTGVVWLGTANGGVNRFDRKGGRIACYKNDPGDSASISSNSISSIYEDARGVLWFGSIYGTLSRFEPTSGKFVNYRINSVENSSARDNGIMMIHEGEDGMLWLCAANGGLVGFDRNTGRYTQFTNSPQDPYSISGNHVLSIAEDDGRILWVGTSGSGLNRLDPSTGSFTRYTLGGQDSGPQTQNYTVNAIVNDGGALWLATDRGLYRFDKTSGRAVFVKDDLQAADTIVFGLLKDGRDNLWLSSANGLIKYNIRSGAFKRYDFMGGLQRNQYNPGAYHKGGDGEMFFGGTNGFSCFYADKIRENTHTPPVVITDFKIFDTPVGLTDDKISLTYRDNFLSFEFSALDYANPPENQYAYKLEGFDADWHYNGSRNYVSYTNLDGGEYVLKVKASNNDGFWNEQGTQIRLVVTPPFWETAWFILAAAILFSASIVVWIKLRIRSLKLKSLEFERQIAERTRELNLANEQLRQADEMKSNFLSMVSHEIRTPLSAILGFTELIAGKIEKTVLPNIDLEDGKIRKATEKISRDLNIILSEGDRLSTLVNNLLNISKIEAGNMDWKIERLDISAIVGQAFSITKPLIEKEGLAFHTDIEAGLPEISGDRDALAQVLINLISNAVKFTREGYIKVRAGNSGGGLLVSVEDTGIGIEEASLGSVFERFFKAGNRMEGGNGGMGLGLYICKQIVEKHGGEIWAESRPGRGSTFYFTIPCLFLNETGNAVIPD